MSYAEVFGGELLFPSQTSYISITTAVDVTLVWPREQQIGGGNVVADFMDIDASAPSVNIDFPSATAIGTGNVATINNLGSNDFDVRDSTGGPIITIIPGTQWIIVLVDNTTAAGTWRSFQLGATVSNATASALGGAGIKAISDTLNQQIDSDVESGTPFTVVDGDRAKCLIYTAGAGTANLPSPGGVGNDWFFMLRNAGSGTLNVLPPSGLVDGAASINMDPGDSAFFFTDGTDFFSIGFGQGNTLAFDFVSIAVPGSGDFVLSGANLDRVSYRFTGLLTGNRRIVVPNTVQQYWIDNQTTGAFTLEIDTAAGAGQTVIQGESVILYCDATDVINATSATSVSFPITVGQGGTGSTTASGARTNLSAAFDGQNMIAGIGMSGGGDLSADRTFDVDQATEGALGGGEIATQAETDAGVDDNRIVTPLKLATAYGAPGIVSVVKTGDTPRTFDNTPSPDPDMVVALAANTNYICYWYGQWDDNAGSGVRVEIGLPGDALVNGAMETSDVLAGTQSSSDAIWQIDDTAARYTDVSITNTVAMSGVMVVRMITAGNLSIDWSQATSNGDATTMRQGSGMMCIPVP